jgi:hypothetical protein
LVPQYHQQVHQVHQQVQVVQPELVLDQLPPVVAVAVGVSIAVDEALPVELVGVEPVGLVVLAEESTFQQGLVVYLLALGQEFLLDHPAVVEPVVAVDASVVGLAIDIETAIVAATAAVLSVVVVD